MANNLRKKATGDGVVAITEDEASAGLRAGGRLLDDPGEEFCAVTFRTITFRSAKPKIIRRCQLIASGRAIPCPQPPAGSCVESRQNYREYLNSEVALLKTLEKHFEPEWPGANSVRSVPKLFP